MTTTSSTTFGELEEQARQRRFSTVEMQDASGNKVILDVNDLSAQDGALAQFGYKPVLTTDLSFCSPFPPRQLLERAPGPYATLWP